MAKKFMYVCIGVLALAGALHLGAHSGSAGYVDHSRTGVVAYFRGTVLLDNGETVSYTHLTLPTN